MALPSRTLDEIVSQPLAVNGGLAAVPDAAEHRDLFRWPIATAEDEQAVLDVLRAGANFPMHLHPISQEADILYQGRPTAIAFGQRDVRQGPGTLTNSERIEELALGVPWFKHDWPDVIKRYAVAYRKVAMQAARLTNRPER